MSLVKRILPPRASLVLPGVLLNSKKLLLSFPFGVYRSSSTSSIELLPILQDLTTYFAVANVDGFD